MKQQIQKKVLKKLTKNSNVNITYITKKPVLFFYKFHMEIHNTK